MNIILSVSMLLFSFRLISISKTTKKKVMVILSICLLLYKTIEYTIYGIQLRPSKIPIELSTITYFLLSITVIFQIDKLRPTAAFMGFVSGIGYMISFIFLADGYVQNIGLYLTTMAFINHSLVLIVGLLLMSEQKFEVLDKRSILLFTAIYVLYVLVVTYFVTFEQKYIFIIMLLDGDILDMLIPNGGPSGFVYIIYYLIILVLYIVIINLFIRINHKLCNVDEVIVNESN